MTDLSLTCTHNGDWAANHNNHWWLVWVGGGPPRHQCSSHTDNNSKPDDHCQQSTNYVCQLHKIPSDPKQFRDPSPKPRSSSLRLLTSFATCIFGRRQGEANFHPILEPEPQVSKAFKLLRSTIPINWSRGQFWRSSWLSWKISPSWIDNGCVCVVALCAMSGLSSWIMGIGGFLHYRAMRGPGCL